jgi:ABC-type nitrate/sulfonate/bicarbonate transport system substrate-binding protein
VAAVVKALILASRDFAKKPALWVDAMAKALPDMKRADLQALSTAYRSRWSVNGGLDVTALKFTTAQLYRSPDFKDLKPVDPATWVDTSYVDGVLKSVGVDKSTDPVSR